MTRRLLCDASFLVLSVAGLVLSSATHVAAIFGLGEPLGAATWVQYPCMVLVWLPILGTASGRARTWPRWITSTNYANRVVWVRRLGILLGCYFSLNFIICYWHGAPKHRRGDPFAQAMLTRAFSGVGVVLYATAAVSHFAAVGGRPALPAK